MDQRTLLQLAKTHGMPLVVVNHKALRENYAQFRKHLPRLQAACTVSVFERSFLWARVRVNIGVAGFRIEGTPKPAPAFWAGVYNPILRLKISTVRQSAPSP
jgi:hypothetical protein